MQHNELSVVVYKCTPIATKFNIFYLGGISQLLNYTDIAGLQGDRSLH
ncbi:hypothetical protein [Nostoc sp.]